MCISTSSSATEKNQLTINDLDDDSLGMIFNKLPYIDRTRIENVCPHWYAVSNANWSTYSKRLTIGVDTGDFLPSYNKTTEKEDILEKILKRSGPYLEEIIIIPTLSFFEKFRMGTIKWIAELCPKLKRLDVGPIRLNDDDWLACSNLTSLSFISVDRKQKSDELGILFRSNKRLRELKMLATPCVTSEFDHLEPGQLELLHIEYCKDFELTADLADKLAESLVDLRYSTVGFKSLPNLQHLRKLKNLRFLNLKVQMEWLETKFITNITKNCRTLESLTLGILAEHPYDLNDIALLFDLPCLRRLLLIVNKYAMSHEERKRLKKRQRPPHLQFFVSRI